MTEQMAEKSCFLSEHDLFQDFSPSQIKQLRRKMTRLIYQPGRYFYRAGEIGQALFILQKGQVYLYRLTPQGRKLIVRTLAAGAVFGEMALIGHRIHHNFALSVARSDVYAISHVEVIGLMRQIPQFSLRLMEVIGQRISESERRLEQLAFLSVPCRLARQLLEVSGRSREICGYTHQEFAEMIGVYRETVSVTLLKFQKLGFIEIGRQQIRIIDRQGLERIVASNLYLPKKCDVKKIKSQLGKE